MTNGKSVKEMASAVVASVGYREDPEAAIAAALQDVADKCWGMAVAREPFWRKPVAEAIRAAFPRGTDGE
jgi:hypothetical protein